MGNTISDILLILSIFSAFRYFVCKGVSSEESFHVNISKHIKDGNILLNGKNKIFTPSGRFTYPLLYHFINSFLPKTFINSLCFRVINCIYDLSLIIAIYVYIYMTFPEMKVMILGYEFSISLLLAIMLTFAPSLIPLNARTRGGGARTMGLFLCTLYFISAYEFKISCNIVFLVSSVLFLFLILFSSLFGNQVAVFATIVISFITLDILIVLPLLIFVLISIIASRDLKSFFLCKFTAHFKYYTSIVKGTLVDDRRKDLLFLPFDFKRLKFDKKKVRTFIYLSPLYFMPLLYSCTIFSACTIYSSINVPLFIEFSQYLCLSLVIIAFITYWYPWSVFGQSERYLEFSTPFSIIVTIYLLQNSELLLLIIFLFIIVAVFHLYLMNKSLKNDIRKTLKVDEVKYLQSISKYKLLVSPFKYTFDCFQLASFNHRFFYPAVNTNSQSNWNENYDLFESYSHYKNDWKLWHQKYGITHLLVHNNKFLDNQDDYKILLPVKRFNNYYLFKFPYS